VVDRDPAARSVSLAERAKTVAPASRRWFSRVARRESRAKGGLWILVALCLTSAVWLTGCGGPLRVADPHFGERHARQNNIPILFYFKAWDSTQHRNMILNVFEDAQVKREMTGIITIELEYAWSTPYKERYRVMGAQVCVMCKPDGTMVHKSLYVNPVPTPERFIKWLKAAKAVAMPKPTSAPAKPASKSPAKPAPKPAPNPAKKPSP